MKKPLIIATAGRKGGSGKTACALSLAAYYNRNGAQVLLVDLDPQGSASLALGSQDASGEDLAAYLSGELETVHSCTFSERLAFIPGGPALESVTDTARALVDLVQGAPVDVLLVDCPPGHADLDRLALAVADAVLICTEPHRLGIAGAARVLDETKRENKRAACALVLGRVDARRGLDRAAPDLLAGAFGVPVFAIHQDAALSAALNAGELPPGNGKAAGDVEALARWITKQQKGNQ